MNGDGAAPRMTPEEMVAHVLEGKNFMDYRLFVNKVSV